MLEMVSFVGDIMLRITTDAKDLAAAKEEPMNITETKGKKHFGQILISKI